jgi:hypothetical protein
MKLNKRKRTELLNKIKRREAELVQLQTEIERLEQKKKLATAYISGATECLDIIQKA